MFHFLHLSSSACFMCVAASVHVDECSVLMRMRHEEAETPPLQSTSSKEPHEPAKRKLAFTPTLDSKSIANIGSMAAL